MEPLFDGIELYLYIKELTEFGLTEVELDQIIYDMFELEVVEFIN